MQVITSDMISSSTTLRQADVVTVEMLTHGFLQAAGTFIVSVISMFGIRSLLVLIFTFIIPFVLSFRS